MASVVTDIVLCRIVAATIDCYVIEGEDRAASGHCVLVSCMDGLMWAVTRILIRAS